MFTQQLFIQRHNLVSGFQPDSIYNNSPFNSPSPQPKSFTPSRLEHSINLNTPTPPITSEINPSAYGISTELAQSFNSWAAHKVNSLSHFNPINQDGATVGIMTNSIYSPNLPASENGILQTIDGAIAGEQTTDLQTWSRNKMTGGKPITLERLQEIFRGTKSNKTKPPGSSGDRQPTDKTNTELGNYLSNVGSAFVEKVKEISQRLGMKSDHLMAVMGFETGGSYRSGIKNQAGSGATGLIQFMPSTARSLGTSTKRLAKMTPTKQLDYVEKYLKPYKGRMKSLQDAYMAVFYPAAIGKKPGTAIIKKGKAYEQNAGLDTNRDGQITIGEATEKVRRYLPQNSSNQPAGKPSDLGNTLSTADNQGRLGTRTLRVSNSVGSKRDPEDFIRFQVADNHTNINLRLDGLSADADVELIQDKNKNGRVDGGEVVGSSQKSGQSSEPMTKFLKNKGDYFIRVASNKTSSETNYTLAITKLSERIRNDKAPANIWRYDKYGRSEKGIDPNKETIVVSHGWNPIVGPHWDVSETGPDFIKALAREASKSGKQVLAVDWSGLSEAVLPSTAAGRIAPVGRWVHDRLTKLGVNPKKLTLIGHSFGSYVSAEIGQNFIKNGSGKVKNLVALDPAVRFDTDENRKLIQFPKKFRDVADRSLALVASNSSQVIGGIPGNNNQAATAHDSFIIKFPDGFSADGPHNRVADVFTNALHRGFLTLPSLNLPSHKDNRYSDIGHSVRWFGNPVRVPGFGHEGVISVAWTGNKIDWSDRQVNRSITGNPVWITGLTLTAPSGKEVTTWN
jgi:pimeloyl-ACP methyl ester carboxylesterase